MAAPTDPLVIWATDDVVLPVSGQQNKIKPQDSLIETGWDQTQKPSAEEFNYLLNNLAQWVEYYGVENITSLLTQYLRKDQNLADLPNKATSRTNLDVYSKSEADAKYLDEANNLSDLDDAATARTNLSVYSKTEVDNKTITAGTGLIDGGTIGSNPTINMGTPSTVGNGSTNSTAADTHNHSLILTTSNISILTGTVTDGQTIPLPSGYIEAQCYWLASARTIGEATSQGDFSVTTSGRVVSITVDGAASASSSASYIIIGYK